MQLNKKIFGPVMLLVAVATVVVAEAVPPQRLGRDVSRNTREKRGTVTERDDVAIAIASAKDTFSRVTMSVTENGRMEIAGVVRFEYIEGGGMKVEVRTDGDFEIDPVLTLNVPVVLTEEGTIVTTAIEAIGLNGANVTFLLRTKPANGIAAKADCHMAIPLPHGTPYCTGPCPVNRPSCDWDIDGSDLICACNNDDLIH